MKRKKSPGDKQTLTKIEKYRKLWYVSSNDERAIMERTSLA